MIQSKKHKQTMANDWRESLMVTFGILVVIPAVLLIILVCCIGMGLCELAGILVGKPLFESLDETRH